MLNLVSAVRLFLWKIILLTGVSLLTVYFFYRVTFINFSPWLAVFSLILFTAEMHTVFHLYGLFYSLWPRNYEKYEKLYKNRSLAFNIFICVCGEPTDIVRQTILGSKKAVEAYKKVVNPFSSPKIYVLNDGKVAKKDNWREIASLAKELGVRHIARRVPGGFKAGNINHALKKTASKNPVNTLDIVFDADFVAKKDFLLEIVKPFEDKKVSFAQSPQRYKNEQTWVAKAAAAHQIFFFEHICAAKGWDNALFLCGTNFAVRRSAFNKIGGMDTRFITEDYATSLNLHLGGYKGVFINKVLAEGIAPASLKQYFSQQQRWSKGSLDVSRAYLKQILFGPLTWQQKFHYLLSATYYLIGIRDFILMLAPLPYLLFGVSLVRANTWQYLLFVYAPLITYNFVLFLLLFRNPIKSLVLDIASFPVFVSAALSSLLKKDLSFIVTIKKYERENPFAVYKLQLLVAVILGLGLFYAFSHFHPHGGSLLNYFWAGFDVTILSFGFYLIVRENYNTALLEKAFFKLSNFVGNVTVAQISFPRASYALLGALAIAFFALQAPAIKTFAGAVLSKDDSVVFQELLVPENGIYYGYYLPTLNSHPQNPIPENLHGEKTSLLMFYQDWAPGANFDSSYMSRISDTNHVPLVTWEPWDSVNNAVGGYSPKDIINGSQDSFIHAWAKNAAAWKKPFFLRFAHEMNGSWYPWGNRNSPDTYIAMWQHVHDIFVQEGATNALWVWSPNNTDELGGSASLLSYYPGDNYVDWVGFSGFNWGTAGNRSQWLSFKDIAWEAYEKLSTINKPIMVAETSSVAVGGDKEAWFNQTLLKDLPELPRIKAVVFFDQKSQGNSADFSLYAGADFNKGLFRRLAGRR